MKKIFLILLTFISIAANAQFSGNANRIAINVTELRKMSGSAGAKCTLLGYYAKGDNGGQELYWDENSLEADNGGTIFKPTNTTKGRWKSSQTKIINTNQFGLLHNNTDETQKLRNIFAANPEKIILNGNVSISDSLFHNRGNLEIDGSGYTITNLTANNTTLLIEGRTSTYTTTADLVKLSNLISLNNTINIKSGDILYINANDLDSLWSYERAYFQKGEFIEVDSVISSTQISIKNKLIDSYISGATITKLIDKNIVIKNLNFVRNNNTACLTVNNIQNVILENVSVLNANERCIYVRYCNNVNVINCRTNAKKQGVINTNYGLIIASSSNVNVQGGYYIAGRHGITTGGWIPCRNVKISDLTVDNYETIGGAASALDFHSNIQFASVNNVTSHNGITLSGIDISISDSYSVSRNQYGFLFLVNRDADNSLFVNRLNIVNQSTISAFAVNSISNGSAYDIQTGNITISNVDIVQKSSMSVSASCVAFLGSSVNKLKYKILNISNINITSNVTQPSGTYAIGFGLNSSSINADAFIKLENIYTDFRARALFVGSSNINALININNCHFKSFFLATNYNSRFGVATYKVQNTTFDGQSISFVESTGADVEFNNCKFLNMQNYCFTGQDLVSAVFNNCRKNNTVAMYNRTGTSPIGIDYTASTSNNKQTTGTAAPTSGTWNRGDLVYNTTVSQGGVIGWICTVSGTPGTWVSFGTINSTANNTLINSSTDTGEKMQVTGSTRLNGTVDINTTSGTLRVPRMTQAQRLALTPSNGDIVYQTDNTVGFYFYENGSWIKK